MLDISTLKRAWSLLDERERRNAWIVLAVVCVSALSSALMVGSVFPFLSVLAQPSAITTNEQLNWAYEAFGFTSSFSFLIALGLVTLAIIVLSSLLQLLRVYAISRYTQMRSHSLSRKLLGLYLAKPYEFFLERHSGDMTTRVLSEAEQAVASYFRPVSEIVAAALTVLGIVTLLVWVNPAVAIGAFTVFGGFYAGLYAILRGTLTSLGKRRKAGNQQRFLMVKEVLAGIKEVKLHGHEHAYLKRFSASSFETKRTVMISDLIGRLPHFFIQAVALGGVVLLCLYLLDPDEFDSGNAALGELLPLLGLIAFAGQRIMPELTRIYSNVAKMRFGAAAIESLFEDLKTVDTETAVAFETRPSNPLGMKSALELRNVTHSYPNSDRPSIRDLSLTIHAGERIGIVGGTGAGKTTLADLILGMLAPTSGSILSDGIEITKENRWRWQQSLGYVPQDIFLLDATLSENIAFGMAKRNIDLERVQQVAKIAQLHKFIETKLPAGYETRVGERGVRLSGGQRQRVGIARALYQGADVIVFDEATSALDNLTERDVMSAIEAVPGNKTILMIAHRLSTVKSCDRIILLEQGRIADIGNWNQLFEQNASFRELASVA